MWGMVEGGREQGKLALNWVCFLGCRAGLIAVVCDWLLVHCNFSFFLFSGGQEDFILSYEPVTRQESKFLSMLWFLISRL